MPTKTDSFDLAAYFSRIGFDGAARPTLGALKALHALHPAAIAFENLDPLLGRAVDLDPATLRAKLVGSRRGGYCFEQNTLFGAALQAMGFEVESLIARVLWGRPAGAITPRSHMLLRVIVDGEAWLCDVGFGGRVQGAPLRLVIGEVQEITGGRYRLIAAGPEFDLETEVGGAWAKMCRFEMAPQAPVDFEVANWFTATHPRSYFTGNLIMARLDAGRRLLLRNREFTIETQEGERESRTLADAADLAEVIETAFGVTPPASPATVFNCLPAADS